MLAALMSMPVSIGLLIWIWQMKKYNPFPRFTFVKLLIAGAIAGTVSAIITLIGAIANAVIDIGPEQLLRLAEPMKKNEYGSYLRMLAEDFDV